MPASHPVLTRCVVPVVFACLASVVWAGDGQADARVLAGPCASCHGPDGHSPGAIPSIAGLPEAGLQQRLTAFRDGSAEDATVMERLMRGYDDAQIAALAHWFSEIEP